MDNTINNELDYWRRRALGLEPLKEFTVGPEALVTVNEITSNVMTKLKAIYKEPPAMAEENRIIQDIVDALLYAIERKDFTVAAAFKTQLWSMGVTVDRHGKWERV